VLMIFFILSAFAIIPSKVADLGNALRARSPYTQTQVGTLKRHVVLTGLLTPTNLKNFLQEIFNEDHNGDPLQVKQVVLLMPQLPTSALKGFLKENVYKKAVHVLRGSAMNHADLMAAQGDTCMGIFILIDQQGENLMGGDARAVMLTRAIRNVVEMKEVPIVAQLSYIASKELIFTPKTSVISMDEVKLSLLARSATAPGISTLVCNLLTSVSEVQANASDDVWQVAYRHGAAHELYRIKLEWDEKQAMPFHRAVELAYMDFQVLLIGLECNGTTVINPVHSEPLRRDDTVIVAARNTHEARQISTLKSREDNQSCDLVFSPTQEANDRQNALRHTVEELSSPRGNTINGGNASPTLFTASEHEDKDHVSPEPDIAEEGVGITKWRQALTGVANALIEARRELDITEAIQGIRRAQKDLQGVVVNAELGSRRLGLLHGHHVSPRGRSESDLQGMLDHHVLLIGPVRNMEYFISEMFEARGGAKGVIITVLHPEQQELDSLKEKLIEAKVPLCSSSKVVCGVRLVRGSPTRKAGLQAAGVEFATSIVILSNPSSFTVGHEYLVDAEAIMVGSLIMSFFPEQIEAQPHLLLELVHPSNISLVDGGDFEAGCIYSNSFLDALVCQAHFNPCILGVLEAFLGKAPTDHEQQRSLHRARRKAAASHHQLMLLMVPEEYVFPQRRSYMELLRGLAQQDCIALGLYRMARNGESQGGYVATNPRPETMLRRGDRMYVITHDQNVDIDPD